MYCCDRCQFYEPKRNGKTRPGFRGDGECRRHPPVDRSKAGPDQAVFPIVCCDWWCGEYKRIT